MNVRISQLWKIPVFCMAAGFLAFYGTVMLTATFGVEQLPDGSFGVNSTFSTLLEIGFFLVTVFLGHLWVRSMTTRERFFSATILVVILLALQIFQFLTQGTPAALQLGVFLTQATEWSRLLSRIAYSVTGNLWFSAFFACFLPYLLVYTGKAK